MPFLSVRLTVLCVKRFYIVIITATEKPVYRKNRYNRSLPKPCLINPVEFGSRKIVVYQISGILARVFGIIHCLVRIVCDFDYGIGPVRNGYICGASRNGDYSSVRVLFRIPVVFIISVRIMPAASVSCPDNGAIIRPDASIILKNRGK